MMGYLLFWSPLQRFFFTRLPGNPKSPGKAPGKEGQNFKVFFSLVQLDLGQFDVACFIFGNIF